MIGEMNANTIRVYKKQNPEFYAALLKYNENHNRKIYIIQGIDFSDHLMYSEQNILDEEVNSKLFEETRELIDAVHGRNIFLDLEQDSFKGYIYDVSDYIIGYLPGIEWDEVFVDYVCRKNKDIDLYNGEYLYCRGDANPFESFLAQWGDELLGYEEEKYGEQHMISFCNWPETDPFVNELEVNIKNFEVQKNIESFVDIERIQTSDKLQSGMFAAYNVYPYFPSFLQYGQYKEYIDETGNPNPYRKYLMTLAEHHSCPVIITEFGIPASRSRAYGEIWKGYSHGGLTEYAQGEAVKHLYRDIEKSGCAGSIVFTWQDEWYKTTWNEKLLSDPDRRAYWSNAECAEQFFGIMSFDPGKKEDIIYPDGDKREWKEEDTVIEGRKKLRIRSDEKYVYFLVEGLDKREGMNYINIALDISPKMGASIAGRKSFSNPVDFIVQIGKNATGRIIVHKDYDMLKYSALGGYHDLSIKSMDNIDKYYNASKAEGYADEFVNICRADGDIFSHLEEKWKINEVGKLYEGNANPVYSEYDSNADYFVGKDFAEIRIPWQLLNFYDPSKCVIIDNTEGQEHMSQGIMIQDFHAAVYYDDEIRIDQFGTYKLEGWNKPTWHERLKKSYYILQDVFKGEEFIDD